MFERVERNPTRHFDLDQYLTPHPNEARRIAAKIAKLPDLLRNLYTPLTQPLELSTSRMRAAHKIRGPLKPPLLALAILQR